MHIKWQETLCPNTLVAVWLMDSHSGGQFGNGCWNWFHFSASAWRNTLYVQAEARPTVFPEGPCISKGTFGSHLNAHQRWMAVLWDIHTMGYCAAIKQNTADVHAWKTPQGIQLGENASFWTTQILATIYDFEITHFYKSYYIGSH